MEAFTSAVIFDMDGVIIDTEPLYTKAEIRLFGEYGVEIPEEDWSLFRGCSEQTFFDLSMDRYGITEDREIFINKGRQYVRDEFLQHLAFMPGFKSLHKRVISCYKTGLVTASPRHNLDWVTGLIGIDNYFSQIISGDDTENNKPHPEPYLAMLERLSVIPENSIVVEDSLHGIKSALAAGCHVIAKTGSIPKEELSIAHRIVEHLDDITLPFLDELLQEIL